MKKILNKFLYLGLISMFAGVTNSAPSDKKNSPPLSGQKLSSVELQWEDTPGAFMYEVEIFNSKGKKLKSFVAKSSLFKFKSTSGKIRLRGRVIDVYGKKGLWTAPIVLEVPPEDIKFPDAVENEVPISAQASNATSKASIGLSWPESIQAKRYKVKIYDQDNKVVQEKETTNLNEKFDLDAGAYHYSVTPVGIDQILGKEIPAPKKIQIGSAQLPPEKFQVFQNGKSLKIKMPPRKNFEIFGALEYANHLSETWTPVLDYTPFTFDIWTPEAKLKPGRYRIGFWATRKGWGSSEKFHHEFVVKPTEADIAQIDKTN